MLLPKEYPSMGLKKKQKCSPSQAMNVGMEDMQKTPETDKDEKRGKKHKCAGSAPISTLCTLLAWCGLFPPASVLIDFTMTQNKTLKEKTPLSSKPVKLLITLRPRLCSAPELGGRRVHSTLNRGP